MDLTNYLDRFKPSKLTNERQELVQRFLERINTYRTGIYKPFSPKEMGIILKKIKTSDLHAFYQECERAKHFYKFFWWKLKQ